MSGAEAPPIANARMYSVSPEVGALWGELLSAIAARSGVPVRVIDHPAPAPLSELWERQDLAAVFMCGLPFSRATPQPVPVAVPVPSGPEFQDGARYWSDFVVRADSPCRSVEDTYGGRLAMTVPDSQSGCIAAMSHFMSLPPRATPYFSEVIAPTITPLGNLTAVAQGAADLAPIDAYALRLLRAYRPDLTARVRVVGRTDTTPMPLLVASRALPALQAAFLEAHRIDSIRALMDKLLLRRFARPDPGDYAGLSERFETTVRHWATHRLAASLHPGFEAYRASSRYTT